MKYNDIKKAWAFSDLFSKVKINRDLKILCLNIIVGDLYFFNRNTFILLHHLSCELDKIQKIRI